MLDNHNNRTLILLTGFACNNNCIMCSLETSRQGGINRTTTEIVADIHRGAKEGFTRIEFTGGEPSIRGDISQLVRVAKSLGFQEIGMSTNGRIFFYEKICKKFIESGLNRVSISLHGPGEKIHDAITRTPGSFKQTIKGIKNIQEFPEITLELATVISKINYKYLIEFWFFISQGLRIKKWALLDTIPDGNANAFYKSLSVRLNILSGYFVKLFYALSENAHISFFDFPLCLFPPFMRNSESTDFVIAKERNYIAEQRGFFPTRIKKKDDFYFDKHKKRIHICQRCIFNARCGGIWQKYIDIYAGEEIATLSYRNRCLKEKEEVK